MKMINNREMQRFLECEKVEDFQFSFVKLNNHLYCPSVKIDFSPIVKQKGIKLSTIPKFNKDGRFYTSAFVVPSQQIRIGSSTSGYANMQREKFMKKLNCAKTPLTVSKPFFNPRNDQYCSICFKSFTSYWKHINSKTHLKKIKSCSANKYIHQLCKPNKMLKRSRKNKDCDQIKPAGKKKYIEKKKKVNAKKQQYCREDFIIKFPKEFLEKDFRLGSTEGPNGFTSVLQKQ